MLEDERCELACEWLRLPCTPKNVIAKLNAEAQRVLAMPDVRERLVKAGIDPADGTPEDFAKLIAAELDKWGPVVKAAGVQVN